VDSQGLLKSAWFARYPQATIAGFDKNSIREPLASHFYQQVYPVKRGEDAIWRNRALLSQVFGYTISSEVSFGGQVPESVDKVDMPKQYHVALHATSKDEKLWPEDKWHALFELMYKKTQEPIYLPWGNETELARAKRLQQGHDFVHICPRYSLLQAALLLQNAQSVVGVDTGLLHLANAFDQVIVGIYLDSNPALTGVQTSTWAQNIGNKNENPSIEAVFILWQQVFAAKQ
jgi:heptosyltransferase-1